MINVTRRLFPLEFFMNQYTKTNADFLIVGVKGYVKIIHCFHNVYKGPKQEKIFSYVSCFNRFYQMYSHKSWLPSGFENAAGYCTCLLSNPFTFVIYKSFKSKK